MPKPPLDPDVADTAPSDSVLTNYDEEHVSAPARRGCATCSLARGRTNSAASWSGTWIWSRPEGV